MPLPQLSTSFYGRRREYRAIRDGFLRKQQRAIIIHGIGGIGKTSLASHIATRLKGQFNGVYAFDCRSGALAPETILLELHRYLSLRGVAVLEQLVHQTIAPDQLATYIAQVLSQIPLLIIFDNFEPHLENVDGKHEIRDENLRTFLMTLVKATTDGTRFLFTSRYVFDVDERRTPLVQTVPLKDLSRPEALGLMQKLAHLSASSYPDKLRVFETFGGHPYALVTLDRHCATKSLEQIFEDASGLHTELREFLAIELSYRSLSDRSRDLLNRFATFRKPVGTDAIHWVIGERIELPPDIISKLDRSEMPDELKTLSDEELNAMLKMLPEVRKAEDSDQPVNELIGWGLLTPIEVDSEVRGYSVHALVRDFCRDKLNDELWGEHLRDAASYYTNQSKLIQRDQKTPEVVWNEMEAFELLYEAYEYEQAAKLLFDIDPLLDRWGFGRYLEVQYRRLLNKVDPPIEAVLIHNLAILMQNRGNYEKALHEFKKSLKIEEEIGNRAGVATSLHQIGVIHQQRGDYAEALRQYEESLKIKEEIGNRAGVAGSLHNIGAIHQDRGDYTEALQEYEKSLKIKEEIGDRAGVAQSLHQIGMIHQDRGDYKAALREYEKSLKIAEEIGDRAGMAASQGQIGKVYVELKRYPEALDLFLSTLNTFVELKSPYAGTTVTNLRDLRERWGEEKFDAAFKEKTDWDFANLIKQSESE